MCSKAEAVEVLVMDCIIVRTRAETRLKAYSINASPFEDKASVAYRPFLLGGHVTDQLNRESPSCLEMVCSINAVNPGQHSH